MSEIEKLIDELESCLKSVWHEDRLGGYNEIELDRRAAKKIIAKWLEQKNE